MSSQIKPQAPLLVVPSVISLRFQLATTVLSQLKKCDFSKGAEGVKKQTTPDLESTLFMVKKTTTVSELLRFLTFVLDQ